jgi:hypothetical protein
MGRAVKEKGQKQREAKSTPHAPTTPSMSERYGFRKLNMSRFGGDIGNAETRMNRALGESVANP